MWHKSLGMGIIQGWLWLFFLNGPLLYGTTAEISGRPENVFLAFLLFNSMSFLIIAKRAKVFTQPGKKPSLTFLAMALITVGTLLTGLAEKDVYLHLYDLVIFSGTLFSGFGAALLISAWGERYSTLLAHQASLAFGLAVTVGTFIFFIVSQLPITMAVLVTAFLPLLSIVFLLREIDSEPEPTTAPYPLYSGSFPFPRKFVFLIILFYLTGGLMFKIIASGQPLSIQSAFWLTNIVYLIVCLSAGGIIYFNPNLDLRFLYRPILPLLGVGFLLFPLLHNSYPVISFTFLQAGFALFDLYTWILFVYLAARHRFRARVVAWGMFLITLAILSGELLFRAVSSIITPAMDEFELISLLAAFLMFIGTMIFRGERETFAGWASPTGFEILEENDQNQWHQVISETACNSGKETSCMPITEEKGSPALLPGEDFACLYNLTPREKQILALLLEGRNNPHIRENLNVSNNTLKTHLRNIYRKLSINDRQGLLDLYKEFLDSLN